MQQGKNIFIGMFFLILFVVSSEYGILAGQFDTYDEAVIEELGIEGAGWINRIDDHEIVIDDVLYPFVTVTRCLGLANNIVSCASFESGDYVGYKVGDKEINDLLLLKKFKKPE